MSLGPVELIVVKFPGSQFTGEIAPALRELVDNGTIRVIDLLFIKKKNGAVATIEMNDLDDEDFAAFEPMVDELTGLFNEDDVRQLAAQLEDNSSAAVMLFENTWATRFRDAVVKAKGELVFNDRIPRVVIDELLRENAATPA
jgi:Family of unknown function (DUF6325)